MLSNVWLALVLTFIFALTWLRLNDFAAHRGWISSRLSRKIIHIGTGPIFVISWLLFPEVPEARFLAALVPLSFTIQFILIGLGIIKDEASVKAMSRSGDPREILKGPVFYGIIFVVMTVIFWLDSPIGIIALMLVCGGDGLADILGNRFGTTKLPWNNEKSWAGSFGMFLGGWLLTVAVLSIFISAGIFNTPLSGYLPAIILIAISATLVESLPLHDIDNITVALTAVLLGFVFF